MLNAGGYEYLECMVEVEVGDVVKETRQAQPPAVKNYSIETPRRMFTPNYSSSGASSSAMPCLMGGQRDA
jgi:hypothetical protein